MARRINFNLRQLDWKYLSFVNPLTSSSSVTMKLTVVCCVVISVGTDIPVTPQDELTFSHPLISPVAPSTGQYFIF